MKIAFDLRRIGNPGIGRYMKCLVETILKRETGHEYVLLLPPAFDSLDASAAMVTRIVPKSSYYSLREQFELPRLLREQRVDLLHSPHFLLPVSRPCPAVVTIHDVIYLACRQDLSSRLGRLYYSMMMRASARQARKIITDSKFSKDEIVRYLNVDPEKISVVYLAVDSCFGRVSDAHALSAVFGKFGINRDYVLCTGIYKPRKNHAGLLRAFQHLRRAGVDAQMVVAGPVNEGEVELRRIAEHLHIDDTIVFTGFIDDSELSALYSGARVYACPSLYEGFGFTVLEAMACGTPVVCSQAGSLPEVGGDAALYANANDPSAFGEALHQAFTDEWLRSQMIRRARENLKRFRWEEAANQCLRIYSEAAGHMLGVPLVC